MINGHDDDGGNAHRQQRYYEDDNASYASGRSYHSASSSQQQPPLRRPQQLPAMPQQQHVPQQQHRYAASDVGASSSAAHAWNGPSPRIPQHNAQHSQYHQNQYHHQQQERTSAYARSAVSESAYPAPAFGGGGGWQQQQQQRGRESNTDLVKGIFRAAAAARRRRTGSFDAGGHVQNSQQPSQRGVVDLNPQRQAQSQGQSDAAKEQDQQTAAQFARNSSLAGYLSKLGTTIPTYKRRFFVLRPQTLLYYFVGADDVEPRGCIELDGQVTVGPDVERLGDGRCRFEIWVGGGGGDDAGADDAYNNDGDGTTNEETETEQRRRVVLEAPNEEVARKWMEAISTERLSHTKSVIAAARQTEGELQGKMRSLEQGLEAMRKFQSERDTALEDVEHWRRRHEGLDEGIRLLTRVVRRPPIASGHNQDDASDGDDDGHADKQREEEQKLLDMSIPDTAFASLRNAMGQLRSSSHLAVQDAEMATERAATLETSLSVAEERIQQLERDNAALRQDSQRRKRDNKILVKEVKNLRCSMEDSRIEEDGRKRSAGEAGRLMAELEAHVATTLQLQQKLLSVSGSPGDRGHKTGTKAESESNDETDLDTKSTAGDEGQNVTNTDNNPNPSKIPTNDNTHKAFTSRKDKDIVRPPDVSDSPSPIAPTKLALVDNNEDAKATKGSLIDDESSSSEDDDTESHAIVTETGQATSRLTCPLVDISSANNTTGRASIKSTASASGAAGGDMYHLTFRSKKIGLQFQKVPALSTKRCSLSSAMIDTSERGRAEDGELGQIAAIARRSEANSSAEQDAKVAMPIDVVLVCGFHGFDDNVNPKSPDLGARLVAFDGISVELGSWTFDSIRRGIQARSRPITLSFRNDPLSIQQREILTKAVAELNNSVPSVPRPMLPHRKNQASHVRTVEDDISSVGTFRSNFSSLMPEHPPSPGGESFVSSSSAASSFIGRLHQVHAAAGFGDTEASGHAEESSYQSFRDIGSARHGGGGEASSVISTGSARSRASGFFSGITGKSNQDEKKPKFMTQESGSLNDHQDHRDFQASLL